MSTSALAIEIIIIATAAAIRLPVYDSCVERQTKQSQHCYIRCRSDAVVNKMFPKLLILAMTLLAVRYLDAKSAFLKQLVGRCFDYSFDSLTSGCCQQNIQMSVSL
jgi:hypothetical protein